MNASVFRRARWGVVLASLLLAACSTTKLPERFHTLLASEPAARAAAGGVPIYVDVLPIAIPAQVDRPEWVVRQPDDSLLLLEQDRWAAPLQDELRGAIVERLTTRWGAIDVHGVAEPSASPWRVQVDVQRFESRPGREARIEAAWSVSTMQRGATRVCRSVLTEPVAAADVAQLAAAHRRAVERLADAIGQALQAAQAGRTAACP